MATTFKVPPGYKRKGANLTQLFSPAIAIKQVEDLHWATERSLHDMLHKWVDDTIYDIRDSMLNDFEKPVFDTGATYESVYGVYPVPRSESLVRSGSQQMQRDYVSEKTLVKYQEGKQRAKTLRRSLQNDSGGIDRAGRTRIDPGDQNLDLSRGVVDTPFHGAGRVKRGNLYAGVGVSTWYSIYPHGGMGMNAIHGERPFFSVPVKRQQKRLFAAMQGGLEASITGRLRQTGRNSVSKLYNASRL